jgi:hypothetical protein
MQRDQETSGLVGQIGDWVFIDFLSIAWGQRCLSGAERSFLGRRGVSLTTYHLLGPLAICPSWTIPTWWRSGFLATDLVANPHSNHPN